MKHLLGALVAGSILIASASAQAPRGWSHATRGGFGRYFYPYGGFGWGFGVGSGGYRTPVYRNAFTGDVTYAERASNDFRAAYERRPGARKAEVQRLDQDLEQLRGEALKYGDVTVRGGDLLRDALAQARAIEAEIGGRDDDLGRRWRNVQRLLANLSRTFRVERE